MFTSNSDAQKRADSIQAVTESFPTIAEYDYVQGIHLVRVSHFLTPTQAKAYEKFAKSLG